MIYYCRKLAREQVRGSSSYVVSSIVVLWSAGLTTVTKADSIADRSMTNEQQQEYVVDH